MDAVEDLLEQLDRYWSLQRGLRPSTLGAYRREARRFLAWLRARDGLEGTLAERLRAVDKRLAARYAVETPVSPATLRRRLYALRALYEGLAWLGLGPARNPFGRLRPPPDDKLPGYLLTAEVRRLLATLHEAAAGDATPTARRDRAIVGMMLYQGLALREVCGLDVDDVDLEAEELRVRGRRHLMPLHPAAKEALEAYLPTARSRAAGRCS